MSSRTSGGCPGTGTGSSSAGATGATAERTQVQKIITNDMSAATPNTPSAHTNGAFISSYMGGPEKAIPAAAYLGWPLAAHDTGEDYEQSYRGSDAAY